jgi:hypothetical protein
MKGETMESSIVTYQCIGDARKGVTMAQFTVTWQFTVQTDSDADPDELHDAIRDEVDTLTLSGTYNATVFDDDGLEQDDSEEIAWEFNDKISDTLSVVEVPAP